MVLDEDKRTEPRVHDVEASQRLSETLKMKILFHFLLVPVHSIVHKYGDVKFCGLQCLINHVKYI